MKIVEREDIGFFKTEIYPFAEPGGKHHPMDGCIVITPRRRKPNGTFVERPEITINMSVYSADIETAEVFAAAYARAIEIAREMAAQRTAEGRSQPRRSCGAVCR